MNQQPSDYLFLIDEQAEVSIQAKLFDTLVNFVEENDVHVERFWYKNDLRRFWNDQHPEGIDLEILQRKYGHCRLVIMGDGHELISERMADGLQIVPPFLKAFGKWKSRQLFTPLPAVSWAFQEIILYRLFQVYPANTQGIEAALSYDFREREEGLEPSFDDWKTQLLKIEKHPDVRHRKWSRLKGYQDYLQDHPTVFTWLCGLAVYENPTWETTIAIGKALESKGVEVTHDNLLILSHLPCLQGEFFKPALRKALMNQLDAETLALARGAIKEELEAVLEAVANSHANRAVQTTLAIQNFALKPEDNVYKAEVRYLLEEEIFRQNQVTELDWEAEKIPKEVHGVKTKNPEYFGGIEDYLGESNQEKAKKSINFKEISIALVVSLLPILLALFCLVINQTDQLYETTFGMTRDEGAKTSKEGLKHYFFVKEEIQTDSAVIYNNMAVDRWEKYLEEGLMKEIEEKELFIFDFLKKEATDQLIPSVPSFSEALLENDSLQFSYSKRDSITQLLQLSLKNKQGYQLAKLNWDKLTFNLAAEQYQKYRANNIHAILLSAEGKFPIESDYDSIALDALHGDGIVSFYVFPAILDSALLRYNKIIELNPTYFDTLQTSPNLKGLLAPILNLQIYTGLIMDKDNEKGLEKVRISSNYFDVLSQ